jgi:hypothetical protein
MIREDVLLVGFQRPIRTNAIRLLCKLRFQQWNLQQMTISPCSSSLLLLLSLTSRQESIHSVTAPHTDPKQSRAWFAANNAGVVMDANSNEWK